MDYSQLIENYLLSCGGSTKVEVSQTNEYAYTANIYYGDEEIENYLGTGSYVVLAFSYIDESTEDNVVGFDVTLEGCKIPEFDMTKGNYNDVNSGVLMGVSLVEEVAREVQKFLRNIRIGNEVWLSLT